MNASIASKTFDQCRAVLPTFQAFYSAAIYWQETEPRSRYAVQSAFQAFYSAAIYQQETEPYL